MDLAVRHGRAGRRPERLGRRAHPGRRDVARRLRRHLPAQHAGLGRRAADLRDHGAVRRRRRLLAGDHRLHRHGRGHELHVRDRARRHQDGDARGGDEGGARRRDDAQREERRRALRRARTTASASLLIRELLGFLPAQQPRRSAARARPPTRSTARTRRSTRSCPSRPNQPYDMLDLIHAVVDDGHFLEVHQHYAQNIIVGFARLGGRPGRHRRQPAGAPGRHARHRRVGEGRAVRPLLRRVQHPAGHLRGRAGVPAGHACRSSAASSATARSCCSPSPRRRCRRSPSSRARRTAAPTA